MANAWYDKAKQAFLEGGVDLTSDNIKATLIDSADYTQNLSTDEFYDDIPAAARVAESSNFTSVTTTDGNFDAADITFSSVSGDECEAIVIWEDDAGGDASSRLLIFIDTATGLSITPNGGDVDVAWNASGIADI